MSTEVIELGEDGEMWMVTGTTSDAEAIQAVEAWLRETLAGDSALEEIVSLLDEAVCTTSDNWWWSEYPNDDVMLLMSADDGEAATAPLFSGVLVKI